MRFGHILVYFDASFDSLKALTWAVQVVKQMHAKITILEVFGSPDKLPGCGRDVTKEINRAIKKLILRRIRGENTIIHRTRIGLVAEEILDEAATGEYDLLALGSATMGDSLSSAICQGTKIPVLLPRTFV